MLANCFSCFHRDFKSGSGRPKRGQGLCPEGSRRFRMKVPRASVYAWEFNHRVGHPSDPKDPNGPQQPPSRSQQFNWGLEDVRGLLNRGSYQPHDSSTWNVGISKTQVPQIVRNNPQKDPHLRKQPYSYLSANALLKSGQKL